ncbi:MAG: hypothetical protein JWP92_486 [Caulobacter sp.]|nr:hypothetical protein [Caulobacter sp.]
MATDTEGWDAQDQAEVLDEDNQSLDADGVVDDELKTFEDLPDVLDVTTAVGDEDDDAGLIGDDLTDDEIIALEEDQDDVDIEDDDLATRMPEAFDDDVVREGEVEEVYLSEELGVDIRDAAEADEDQVERITGGPDDLDLAEAEDAEAVSVHDARRATGLESKTVSDEDLDDLGYDGARDRDARRDTPDGPVE